MHRDSKTTKKSIDSLSTLRRTLISLPVCSSLAAILATGFVTPVAAKQGAAPLEEFVVTARKREEGIQDVPIAITAITGEELQQANISDMTRLAAIVPNFHHAEAVPSSDQFIIRGLGTTGVNIGFEQAVGMVFNGFFLGNSRFGRTAFLDVQRVEVLKGPQGALIGKNNSVGAVSIVSRRPGDELEGYLLGSYETEAGEGYGLEGAVSIPFSENARGRFAFRQEDVDGWTENTATGTPEQTRDDLTLRAILDIEISERVGLEFLFQYGDLQRNGRNREPWNCANNATSANPSDPGEDCLLNYTRQVQRIVMGEPVDEPHSTEYSLLGVTADVDFEGFTLSSLTSFNEFEANDRWDSDYALVERTHLGFDLEYEQFSQEFRLTSTGDGSVDTIAGVYFQSNDIFRPPFANVFCRSSRPNCTWGDVANGDIFNGYSRVQTFRQETESLSVFGQIDWHISDALTLSLGGRFTDEDKDASGEQWIAEPYDVTSRLPNCNEPSGYARYANAGCFPGLRDNVPGSTSRDNNFSGSRSESDFSPNLTLRWQPSDDSTYYVTYSEGFKSGGFQLWPSVNQAVLAATIPFEDERTSHIEVGGKHTLAGGLARLNWAAWNTEFTDVQVSALDAVQILQRITNAAEAHSRGIEADLAWAPTEGFLLNAAVAYTNAEFDDFIGNCYTQQTAAAGCIAQPSLGGAPGQDLSGTALSYAPEWQATIGAEYTLPLGDLQLVLGALYYWKDEQFLDLDHDPLDVQGAVGKLDLRLALGGVDGRWELALLGRNLTDELSKNFSSDTTAAGQAGDIINGPHFSFLDPPRQVSVQARYNF